MTSKKIKWVRLLAAFLALTMTLGFTGCDNGNDDSSSSSTSEGEDEQTEIHKVGYIFRENIADGGMAAQMCEQRERASNRSSVETCYIDNVSLSNLEDAVKALSDAGCTDIVSCSPTYANVISSIAKKYLDLNFISCGSLYDSMNFSAYSEAPYQGAYIAGLVANFNSNAKKIGVVADTALACPIAVVNAVQLGSQINQDGGAIVYAASAEKDSEIEEAIDALLEKGCDVIVCYTNSEHSADYCQQKGVSFIGCLDYRERETEYSKMLMYFYTLRDSYFLGQFKSMKFGSWSADAYIGDMSNGIVNVSPALNAAEGTQDLIDALLPYVTNGSAMVFRGPLKDNSDNIKYLEVEIMTDLQINNMDWYVKGAEPIGNFRRPQTDIPSGSLDIKS